MKGAKHEFKYRYVCEKCGKQTNWIEAEFQEETSANNLEEVIHSIVDKNKFKKQLQKFKEKVDGGGYDYHFQGGAMCPFCGVRQSWLPITSQSIYSPWKRIVIYPCLNIFYGLIILIIYFVCRANYMLENIDDNTVLIIAFGVLPATGLLLAIRRNIINAKLDKKQESEITVKNKPEIDWNEYQPQAE